MKQKPVTFEVAKVLKEAGYPQKGCDLYYNENGTVRCCSPHTFTETCACPTYLSTWLWLWREKKECINIMTDIHGDCRSVCNNGDVMPKYADPEEAIAKAIDYLVENKLLK